MITFDNRNLLLTPVGPIPLEIFDSSKFRSPRGPGGVHPSLPGLGVVGEGSAERIHCRVVEGNPNVCG